MGQWYPFGMALAGHYRLLFGQIREPLVHQGGDVPVARGRGWLGLEEIQCILTATTIFGFTDAPHAHLTAVIISQCPATAVAPAETAGEHHLSSGKVLLADDSQCEHHTPRLNQ